MRLGLWLLSTWYGTFCLCGPLSLSSKFPFFRNFCEIPQETREKILLAWSNSRISALVKFFISVKALICLAFYSKVDHNGDNPTWKAIGYCGADPRRNTRSDGGHEPPLAQKVLDLADVDEADVSEVLRGAGCSVCEGENSVRRLWKKTKGRADNREPAATVKCDVVVVGSGSGGGVVAGVLAQAGLHVIVLEKGRYFAGDQLSLLEGPTMDEMYESGGIVCTDDLHMLIMAGSTVGGGSCINWSACIRTPPEVLREWSRDLNLKVFDSPQYRQAMDAVCCRMSVTEEQTEPEEGFNNTILRKGATTLGYAVRNVPRNNQGDAAHMCGWCNFGCKTGTKQGTHETWLVDAVNNGAVIMTSVEAVALITDRKGPKRTAVGVAAMTGVDSAVTILVEARATVIACGTLRTPQLLKRSGLRNPNIGKHLHLHPVRMGWGRFADNDWPSRDMKSYEGAIITSMVNADGVLIQTPALHPGGFAAVMPWTSGAEMKRRMAGFSRTAHLFALARDRSSGHVDFPGSIRYQVSDPRDARALSIGIERILRILVAAGAEEIGTHHLSGESLDVKHSSAEEIEEFIKKAASRKISNQKCLLLSAHQMGSCRMGTDPRSSVVNEKGECWEVQNLFLGDGSVLPSALGVNPMVTIQSIAFCTASAVLARLATPQEVASADRHK
eukprot:TRINITY_DN6031_c0_g1_i3.p1 TRINITY_DN6031_c0_g1~~TRINITY_DN6031_c0_g1_i3.p1  ORF type:complete len:671 (-),score=-57.36 TRINITY_DN6031_c0_g1_i3:67-2079(-)